MNRIIVAVLWVLALHAVTPTSKGGDVAACFHTQDMGECNREALQHVDFKSVVLQFVDPGETELGEGLARLFWREILESISDLKGAGVIMAYDRNDQIRDALEGQDVQTFLQRDYHNAALKIAEFQKTQMAVWGAVLKDGDGIYLQNYLTLREPEDNAWMEMSVGFPGGQSVSVPFIRRQFNLPAVSGTRNELLGRHFFTRCRLDGGCAQGIALRSEPSNASDIVTHVAEGSAVKVIDMTRQWLRVESKTSQDLWINIYHLEMYPKDLTFNNVTSVNLRKGPEQARLASVNLNGNYAVLNAARAGRWDTPWYQIEVMGQRGWVRRDVATSRSYTFPAVHLIAGFYRYNAGQYKLAGREFSDYLTVVPEEDNVTRSGVLKLMAASELAGSSARDRSVNVASDYLDQAEQYTPYDASVYSLRALLNMASAQRFAAALEDLQRAYLLNARDPAFVAIAVFLRRLQVTGKMKEVVPDDLVRRTRELLKIWGR